MLPTNFAGLADRQPQLRSALESLEQWIGANPRIDHIDVRRVLTERPQVDPSKLALALVALEDAGLLKEKFALIAPTNHALTDEFYDSLNEIPSQVHDTTDRVFDTDDAEVIPIYVGVGR